LQVLADSGVFGADLLVWLVLALGAAMVVGYGAALWRPPPAKSVSKGKGRAKAAKRGPGKTVVKDGRGASRRSEQLAQAPRGRSLVMIGIGATATIWSLATLVKR
jgi:hypothetical protein